MDDSLSSATYDQIVAAYHTMLDSAKPDTSDPVIWEGALTTKLEENGIPKSRYSVITKFLRDMGCIERYRRGAGQVPSVWLLHREPTWEAFTAVRLSRSPHAKISPDRQRLEDRVTALEDRLEKAGI